MCLGALLPWNASSKGSIFQLSDTASGSTNVVSLERGYLFGLTNDRWDVLKGNLFENNPLAMLVMQKLQTSALKVMMHVTVKTATLEC